MGEHRVAGCGRNVSRFGALGANAALNHSMGKPSHSAEAFTQVVNSRALPARNVRLIENAEMAEHLPQRLRASLARINQIFN